MTKRQTISPKENQSSFSFQAQGTSAKHPATWRSLEEKADPSRNAEERIGESGIQVEVASLMKRKTEGASDVSRRNFMLASA